MKLFKNKNEENMFHCNAFIGCVNDAISFETDENGIFLEYQTFKFVVSVVEGIPLNLKKIKNHCEEKAKIYDYIKSIQHIIDLNKKYYEDRSEK